MTLLNKVGLHGVHGMLLFAVPMGAILVGLFILGSFLHKSQTKQEFTQPGLWGIVGFFGSGKSYLMTWAARQAQKQTLCMVRGWSVAVQEEMVSEADRKNKRPIYANYRVRGTIPVNSWQEILQAPWGSVILIDEAHLWWPSYVWDVDPSLEKWASQVRKHGYTVLYTTQDYTFLSKRLRRLTAGVWEGSPFLKGHKYCLYKASGFDQFRQKRPKPDAKMNIRRRKSVMSMYNTLEIVDVKEPPRRSLKPGEQRTTVGGLE